MKGLLTLIFSVFAFNICAEIGLQEKKVVTEVLNINKIGTTSGNISAPNCYPSPTAIPPKLKWATVYDWKGRVMNVNIVTPEHAIELFNKMKNQPQIPFDYPADGCYARAHEMSMLLEKEGVITGKAFIEGDLRVETPSSTKGYVEWRYHVAPMLVVKERENSYKIYIIDPSIFDKPVPVEEWQKIQTKHFSGRMEKNYYTKRFYYSTNSLKDDDRQTYLQENVDDTKVSLKKFLDLQNKLKGK